MFARLQKPPERSFFLFGPRGTGKTAWLKQTFADALTFDLLESGEFQRLTAAPQRLGDLIPKGYRGWVVLDEIQRVPELLNEVHRLIEGRRLRFAMAGSGARKLRKGGVNLLAGRARTLQMHPLTAIELGDDFDLVRNLPAFTRFLETASFSQGAVLNMASIARECAVSAKLAESHFVLLEDLLLATRIPVFVRRARRRMTSHPKFYFFDCGVFRALRPRGPLDIEAEIDGPALETLFLANLRAINDVLELGYSIHYWRTAVGTEVDFVLYGEHGLLAFEIKRASRLRDADLAPLLAFGSEYPMAKLFLLHTGRERRHEQGVEILPLATALTDLDAILRGDA
ncbi:MAG: ATP-binding protein [Planctomycetes bacterium]|nr:ATP-binding protein [Planctomycetota bacterium]